MKISCPSCSAKYSIADEKVQNRLAKIRCRKCGTSIVIDGNVSPANVYAADGDARTSGPAAGGAVSAPPSEAHSGAAYGGAAQQFSAQAPAEQQAPTAGAGAAQTAVYIVDFGENDQRQMTMADVVNAYNSGAITAETYLWTDGFVDWTPLAQIEEVVAALQEAARRIDETSAAGASTAPAENPWADSAGAAAPPTPEPAPTGPAAGTDLFGGIEQAGSEAEVATSGSSAGGTASPFGDAGGSSPSHTGARNESSVLFSLSALTSAAGNSRPSVPPSTPAAEGNDDDSGLIDLKALTATAEAKPPAQPPAAAAPLGLGGGAASPLGAPGAGPSPHSMSPSLPPQSGKSNTGLFIGGGIVVAAVAVALIVVFGGKEEPPPPPPAPAPVAAPTPPPPPMPTEEKAEETEALPSAEAKAPSTGTAEEEESPAKQKTATKKTYRKKSTSSGSSKSQKPSSSGSTKKAAPKPKPKKKKSSGGGGCGCAPDDLMCNMRCSSK